MAEARPIKVSTKTLAHISSGLYRSTAGALKELVSNAFDADATQVKITTNKPSFDVFTCSDNGNAITKDEFESLMDGGIGYSSKRKRSGLTELGRPVIGRLGIGLLAMTQVSHGFRLVSHHPKSGSAFDATIAIQDYLPSHVDVESEVGEPSEIGVYEVRDIPYDEGRSGVTIVSTEMRTGLIRRFQESAKTDLPLKFEPLLRKLQRLHSVARQGPYWDLIWGLSVYCPVRYVPSGPVHGKRVIANVKTDLEEYDFDVFVDGMPLRKPLRLPSAPDRRRGLESFVKTIKVDGVVEGQPLRLDGYVYAQEGKSILPVELRGILIRIRNVGIGGYDKTFLDYEIAEGPRFGWLTGEIYVHEGLEDALNVDRDSFNASHPHYLKLREVLHSTLQDVFSQLYKGIDRRSRQKRKALTTGREQQFEHDLNQMYGKRFDLLAVDHVGDDHPVKVEVDEGKIWVAEDWDWPRQQDRRLFAQQLVIAWELAASEGTMQARRKRFQELYERVLRNFDRW